MKCFVMEGFYGFVSLQTIRMEHVLFLLKRYLSTGMSSGSLTVPRIIPDCSKVKEVLASCPDQGFPHD